MNEGTAQVRSAEAVRLSEESSEMLAETKLPHDCGVACWAPKSMASAALMESR